MSADSAPGPVHWRRSSARWISARRARDADRIIRLSWTLADLAGTDRPRLSEVGFALGLWLGAA